MIIIEKKRALRKLMLQRRGEVAVLGKKEYDDWICTELEKLIIEKNYKVIHSYIPFAGEIDITPLLKKLLSLNFTIVCPKTLPKRKLENRILTDIEKLEVGIMGTKHPAEPVIYEGAYDLIIVPGLAFDTNKFRVGYGGGYYDNFLAVHPESFKVGIFYPFQKVEEVPIEPHDICLDLIFSKEF